jgi:hypothetical protein
MSMWATVVLTLGSAMVGALAALAAAYIQIRNADRSRRTAERNARREKGAEAIGPIMALLNDADPTLLFIVVEEGRDLSQEIRKLQETWKPLRDRLFVYAAGHPSGAVTERTQEVVATMTGLLVDLRIAAKDGGREGLFESHRDAMLSAASLLAEVRGEPLRLGSARDLNEK